MVQSHFASAEQHWPHCQQWEDSSVWFVPPGKIGQKRSSKDWAWNTWVAMLLFFMSEHSVISYHDHLSMRSLSWLYSRSKNIFSKISVWPPKWLGHLFSHRFFGTQASNAWRMPKASQLGWRRRAHPVGRCPLRTSKERAAVVLLGKELRQRAIFGSWKVETWFLETYSSELDFPNCEH